MSDENTNNEARIGLSLLNAGLGKQMELIGQVGEQLLGTCKSADEVIQTVFEDDDLTIEALPIEVLYKLDEITMECATCNWWFEPHELDDSQTCKDCGGTFDNDA